MPPRTPTKAKEKESDVQRAILDFLGYSNIFHYRNNSGAMFSTYKGKERFMRFGALGSPDIVVVIKGLYIGLEVKGTGMKQSENQKKFQQELENAGGYYFVVYSVDDVQRILKGFS